MTETWTRLRVRRPPSGWVLVFGIAAVAASFALGTLALRIATVAPRSAIGWGGSIAGLVVLAGMLVTFVFVIRTTRRTRVEIHREGIRVVMHADERVRWDEVRALWKLRWRDGRGNAHPAGWAIDVAGARRVRISPTFGDLSGDLAAPLEARGVRAVEVDLDQLPLPA